MSYSKLTINNRSLIKKLSHKKRFNVSQKLIEAYTKDFVLDFGTGDGYLLTQLAKDHPEFHIVGYEPLDFMFEELKAHVKSTSYNNIDITMSLKEFCKTSIETISCFEVLEHFTAKAQYEHLDTIKNLLKTNGTLIVSVPLEIGLSSLFKNSVRILVKQRHANTNLKSIIRAFLGKPIKRTQTGYIYSHIGFSHKELETVFREVGFKIIKKTYSPIPWLSGLLNSQVFYVLKKIA